MTTQEQQLQDALTIMDSDPATKPIADYLRGLDVGFADFVMDKDSLAVYNHETNRVWINTRYTFDTEELADSLVHEGTHALNYRDNKGIKPLTTEENAYTAGAEYWSRRFPDGRHVTHDETEESANYNVEQLHNGTLKKLVGQIEERKNLRGLFGVLFN